MAPASAPMSPTGTRLTLSVVRFRTSRNGPDVGRDHRGAGRQCLERRQPEALVERREAERCRMGDHSPQRRRVQIAERDDVSCREPGGVQGRAPAGGTGKDERRAPVDPRDAPGGRRPAGSRRPCAARGCRRRAGSAPAARGQEGAAAWAGSNQAGSTPSGMARTRSAGKRVLLDDLLGDRLRIGQDERGPRQGLRHQLAVAADAADTVCRVAQVGQVMNGDDAGASRAPEAGARSWSRGRRRRARRASAWRALGALPGRAAAAGRGPAGPRPRHPRAGATAAPRVRAR